MHRGGSRGGRLGSGSAIAGRFRHELSLHFVFQPVSSFVVNLTREWHTSINLIAAINNINGFHLHGRMPVQLLRSFRFYAAKPERCRETLSRSCCQARQSPSPRWLTFKTKELAFVRMFSFCEAAYSELRSDTPEYNPHRDENHVIGPLLPPTNNAKYIHSFIVSILILISAALYCKVDVDVPGQWTPAGRCDQLSSLFAQKSLRTIWANGK